VTAIQRVSSPTDPITLPSSHNNKNPPRALAWRPNPTATPRPRLFRARDTSRPDRRFSILIPQYTDQTSKPIATAANDATLDITRV